MKGSFEVRKQINLKLLLKIWGEECCPTDTQNQDLSSIKPKCQSILTFEPFFQQLIPDSRPPRTWLAWTHQTTPCRLAFLSLCRLPFSYFLCPPISVIDVGLGSLCDSRSDFASTFPYLLTLFFSANLLFKNIRNSKIVFLCFLLHFIRLFLPGCHRVQGLFTRSSTDVWCSNRWKNNVKNLNVSRSNAGQLFYSRSICVCILRLNYI